MMHGIGGWHHQQTQAQSGLSDDDALGKAYDHKIVVRLMKYVGPYKGQAILSALTMVIYTLTGVAIPWIIKLGIDSYISKGDLSGLNVIAVLLVMTALVNWASNYIQTMSMARVSQGVLYSLRNRMFLHLQNLSPSFYDKSEVGRIMSRVQNDVNNLQEFLSVAILTTGDLLSLFGIVIALLLMDIELGLITMAVVPFLVLIMIWWQKYAVGAFMRVRRAISIVNGALHENIAGVRVVQSMNRQDTNLQQFDAKNREHLEANLYAARLSAGLMPVVDILTGISIGLVIVFGGEMVLAKSLAVGTLVAFVLYIQRFFDPIRNLTMQYTQFQRAMASGVRIFELLDVKPDVVDAKDASDLPPIKGEVELERVSFGYVPGVDVLKDVSLHINPGETVAIVGPTGAGKTTLVSLLSRFYDVNEGRILVDGHDIRSVTRRSLASQMSMVLQEPFLFSGTVKENIKFNHVNATDDEVIEAAKAVNAHDFVMRLEKGYDTYLQERGSNLSIGQRQLISFARAIVANPHILILDEATANIDSYTEMLIQKALQNLLQGRTAIVIAHRLSTIRGADKIVVLDHGRIVEVGKHQELLEKGGLYAKLYAMNFSLLCSTLASASGSDG